MLVKVALNRLLDGQNMILVEAVTAEEDPPWQRDYTAPVWQDFADAYDYALHI